MTRKSFSLGLLFLAFSLSFFLSFTLTSTAQAARPETVLDRPTLFWRNGDVLNGDMVSANSSDLTWRADTFAQPLRVRLDALHMIRFPQVTDPSAERAAAWQIIETRDGNRFFGQVTNSDEESISVDTVLFGPILLQRSAVSMIANPVERAHVYSGPKGLRGWSTLTYGRRLSEWEEISSGRLMTRMVAAELFRSLPATGSVDVDVEFLWRNNPSFQLRFFTPYATPTKETIKIETRSTGFIIQSLGSNGRFRQLETLPNDATKCRIRLRWSHTSGQLSIYLGRKYLGKLEVKQQQDSGPAGIFIKNTGPQLTLSRLEVRASSTLDIGLADPAKDTVLQSDNKSVAGQITSMTSDSVSLDTGEDVQTLKWSDVAEIAFQIENGPVEPQGNLAECVFQNGETLRGAVLKADSQSIEITIPSIDRPLVCRYEMLERIVMGAKSIPPKVGTPALQMGDTRIHGSLAIGADNQIGWLPTGGVSPVSLKPGQNGRFELQRQLTSTVGSPQDDLVYLRNGDVIPCSLQTADATKLRLKSRFSGECQLDSEQIHAVELAVDRVAPIEGFDDRWSVANEKLATIGLQGGDNNLRFIGATEVTRPGILHGCDRIEFQMRRFAGSGGVYLHLVLLGDREVSEKSLPFYFMDEKLFVLGSKRNAFIPCKVDTDYFDVMIETHDPFRVQVNGKVVYAIPGNENGGPWSGVGIEVSNGPLFGPAVRPKRQEIDVEVKGLRISQTKRPSLRQTTGGLDSEAILTIPRNREKESLTHLAIGTNNDAVRGTLVKLDDGLVQMQSKAEAIRLARSSVAGLIWLHQRPDVLPEKHALTRIILNDTTTISLANARLNEEFILGDHPVLGNFQVPRSNIQAILSGDTPNVFHEYAFMGWKAQAAREPEFATSSSDGHLLNSPLVGRPVKFAAKMLDTGEPLLLNELHGKVVVLDFWASWCAPCVRNMPKLISAIGSFPGEKVQLIAVNEGEDPRLVDALISAKQWELQVATDPFNTATQAMGIEALPQTIVLDQAGHVAAVYLGTSAGLHSELITKIKELIGE